MSIRLDAVEQRARKAAENADRVSRAGLPQVWVLKRVPIATALSSQAMTNALNRPGIPVHDNLKKGAATMSLIISQHTEARLTEEAHRRGLSVDALIERLISEPTTAPIVPLPGRLATPTVFEQGLGMFGSPEDAALIDEVVSLAYAERRRPSKDQPLAL
ncbi:MAG: hypothetical protein ABJC09_14170 [Terriglobia bacterium]